MIVESRNFGLEVEKKIGKNIEENNDTDDNFTMILNNLRDRDIMLKPVMIDNMVIGNKIENTENADDAQHTKITEVITKIDNLEKITLASPRDNQKHDSNDSDKKNIDNDNENIEIEIEMEIMTALVPFGDMLNHERPRQVREIFFEDNK